MTDLPIIIVLILLFSFNSLALEAEAEIQNAVAVNVMLWEEGSMISEKYNACKKQIRSKR